MAARRWTDTAIDNLAARVATLEGRRVRDEPGWVTVFKALATAIAALGALLAPALAVLLS